MNHKCIDNMSKQELTIELKLLLVEYQTLTKSARAILMQQKFEESAREIFSFCKIVTGATSGYVALLSPDGSENEVLFLDSGGLMCTVDENLPMPIRGLRETAYRSLKGVYHNSFADSHWVKFLPEGHMQLDNVMFAPLIIDQQVVGLIGLANKKGGFTQRDVDFASSLGDIAAIALRNSRNFEAVQYLSFHDQLTGLYNRHFLENEMKRLDTERQLPISIIMADLNGLKLVNDTFGHEVGDEMLEHTAEILRDSCRREDIIARWGGDEFTILLPQTTRENTNIICNRINEKCKETYIKDIPLSLALGSAIKNSTEKALAETITEAEEDMYKQKIAKRQRITSAVLNTLLQNLEAKSFETEAHYSSMQAVAQKIGKKIGLSESELNRLEKLIQMHDIGKTNISEEILTKKGSLTAEEWEVMKKHPETGFRIARATEEFALVAEEILSHHERWDGTGYPNGLKEEEIPLLARITAVADAYEVMANGRPYKEPMTKEEIDKEFKRCAGIHFDPELVDVFLKILKEEY